MTVAVEVEVAVVTAGPLEPRALWAFSRHCLASADRRLSVQNTSDTLSRNQNIEREAE